MRYSGQDMLWLIGSLSRIFRLPFDARLVRQHFPPPYSRVSLIAALQSLDFKVGEMELGEEGITTLERMPFPIVAFLPEDEAAGEGGGALQESALSRPIAHPSPASGRGAGGESDAGASAKLATLALLIKADEQRVLFTRAGAKQPETVPLAEFTRCFRWTSKVGLQRGQHLMALPY